MRSPSLKTIFTCTIIIIAIVLGIQVYWLINIPEAESKQFAFWLITAIILLVAVSAMIGLLIYFHKHKLSHEVQKEFVDNFIHEFKTPVSVLNIAGSVVASENIGQHPARLKKYGGIIKEQAEQLQHKVGRILEFELIEKRDIVLERKSTSLNPLIEKAISFVQPLIDEKNASMVFEPAPETEIKCDGIYIVQVFVNILENSLKYSDTPAIRIETSQNEKSCIVSIKDNGIGIDKQYQKDIFKKFYRVPTGNVHNVKGLGIGLNFVKKVLDAHNGRIEVKSVPGMGTEMRILLPLS
jgi:two-component system phosphate regulon sensor histidine kinase PhoR